MSFLLSFENLEIYQKGRCLISDFNLKLERGKIYPLIYDSTGEDFRYFFRFLLGMRGEIAGKIETDQEFLAENWRESSAFLPARGGFYPELKVAEQLELISDKYGHLNLERALEICRQFNISRQNLLKKLPEYQGRIVLLAGLLASSARILLLEEPGSNLPAVQEEKLLNLLQNFLSSGRTILLIVREEQAEKYPGEYFYFLTPAGLRIEPRGEQQGFSQKNEVKVNKIAVWEDESARLIDHDSINWISTSGGKSTLHTDQEEFEINLLLKDLEEQLSFPPFFRCHRSFIVNLEKIDRISSWFQGKLNIYIAGEKIPVSRSRAAELKDFLDV